MGRSRAETERYERAEAERIKVERRSKADESARVEAER